MNKKDIEALSEKLKRCREIPLDEVNLINPAMLLFERKEYLIF